MTIPATIAKTLQQPQKRSRLLMASEVLIALAAVIALVAVQKPGPIILALFLVVAQACILIGVVLYLAVTIIEFLRHRGVSRAHFTPREIVFRQGDQGDFVYTIVSGEVEVIREDPERGETVLARLGPGEYFGEMALVSDAPRTATVRTVTPVEAVVMARTDFTTLYAYLPDLHQSLDKVMRQRKTS
jgi:Cyclic nucleotide-binding domain